MNKQLKDAAILALATAAAESAECDRFTLLPYIRAAWEHKIPKKEVDIQP
jgi:hypothetical protein